MPDEGGTLERCQELRPEAYRSVVEEFQEVIGITANQVEVLRSIDNVLLQGMWGTGSNLEILLAPTVHYLLYTLVLMKCVLTERERWLHQV